MTNTMLYLHGILVGVLTSAPLGSVGFALMQRSSTAGFRASLLSGAVIALLGSTFGFGVLYGVGKGLALAEMIPHWLVAFSSLLFFGYGFWFFYIHPHYPNKQTLDWRRYFFAVMYRALRHPTTYASFAIIGMLIAQLFDRPVHTHAEAAAGFFTGALLVWGILAWLAFSKRLYYRGADELQRVNAAVIMVLAAITFTSLFV